MSEDNDVGGCHRSLMEAFVTNDEGVAEGVTSVGDVTGAGVSK